MELGEFFVWGVVTAISVVVTYRVTGHFIDRVSERVFNRLPEGVQSRIREFYNVEGENVNPHQSLEGFPLNKTPRNRKMSLEDLLLPELQEVLKAELTGEVKHQGTVKMLGKEWDVDLTVKLSTKNLDETLKKTVVMENPLFSDEGYEEV